MNATKSLPQSVVNSSTLLTSIWTTTNYTLFGFIGGNRNVNKTNLKKITESISRKHIKTNAVICVYDDSDPKHPLKIVDGQHRFEACVELNLPVSYVIDDSLSINDILNDITLLNTASKEWDVSDFMNSEAQKGNQNYILYRDIYSRYSGNFDHESLFYILNNSTQRTQKVGYTLFKEGGLQFDMNDHMYLDNRLRTLSLFNTYCEIGGKRYYQKALNTLHNITGFNNQYMLGKLQKRISNITKCTTVDGALEQLSNIYNYKKQKDIIGVTKANNKIHKVEII